MRSSGARSIVFVAGLVLVTLLGGYWVLTSSGLAPGSLQTPIPGDLPDQVFDGEEREPGAGILEPASSSPSVVEGEVAAAAAYVAAAASSSRSGVASRDPAGIRPGAATLPAATASTGLLVPVEGVRPEQLVDTYNQARSAGRRHDAIDIIAPRGTPVYATTVGTVLKLFQSEQGGITLYQLAPDQRTIYYYAHLDRYAAGIAEGAQLRRGQTIGYVGDTGNSGTGNYHLHFEVSTTLDPKKYWGGTPTNPYPLLLGGQPAL